MHCTRKFKWRSSLKSHELGCVFEFSRTNNKNKNNNNSHSNNIVQQQGQGFSQQVVHHHHHQQQPHFQIEPLPTLPALQQQQRQYEEQRRLVNDMGGNSGGGMKQGMAAGWDIKVDTTVVGVRPVYDQEMMSYVP